MCARRWQILTLNPATDKLTYTLWQVSTVSVLFTAMFEVHDVNGGEKFLGGRHSLVPTPSLKAGEVMETFLTCAAFAAFFPN